MAHKIIMPKTGMAMEEGVILEWFKSEGESVVQGEIIAEIETDKTTMELESDYEGTLLKILYPASATVPVVRTIAWIGEPGEELPEDEPERATENRVKATPAARRAASERNVNLDAVTPSGRQGEIREADVSGVSRADGQLVKLSRIQKISAERMTKSFAEVPAVTLNAEADVTEMLEIREKINAELEDKISINDFIMLATAQVLRLHPRLNSELADPDHLFYLSSINLGMAVAGTRGLLVPVIRNADKLSLVEMASATKDLSRRGRNGELHSEDLDGGTFTVSNLGMFGVTSFNLIINQPQAGILGVCAVEDKPGVIDGSIAARKIMGLSLAFDHRILDGAEAAAALKSLTEILETPQVICA